jgi:hypothetical protein
MPDLLSKARSWLAGQLKAHAAVEVVYRRGEDLCELTAAKGQSLFGVDDGAGIAVNYESIDWLCDAADLVLDGEVALPEKGDRIEETDEGGAVQVYEVTAPGTEPAWRYRDPERLRLRIHSKYIGPTA